SVQNGGVKEPVTTRIKRDFATLDSGLGSNDLEVAKLRIIANRRAEAASRRWVEDVRVRKLTIANGERVVHGRRYDLETQYGIRLTQAAPSGLRLAVGAGQSASCPSWDRTRTLLIQSQACCQLHQGAEILGV